jgi:hypothetical protein
MGMAMIRLILIICAFGLSTFASSTYADTQRFIVVGNGVIFALAEPSGWKMDTNSRNNNGLPVVYYPRGQQWGTAPSVIYANVAVNDCQTSFERFVSNDLNDFKSNNPQIVIKEGEVLTVDGKKVVIKRFSGDKYGNSEAVAYVDNQGGAFISITLTSRTQQQFDQAFPIFKELVSSLQIVGNSVSCIGKPPSFSERVAIGKRAEEHKEIYNYLYKEMFPAISSNMANLMKSCLAKKNSSVDKFTIVADIVEPRIFKEVDFEPKTNTASCFAEGLAALQLPTTKSCQCTSLPVVLEMAITP